MLTSAGCLARRTRLWQRLPSEVDCVVVTSAPALIYLAGFEASPYAFSSQEAPAALLLHRRGDAILVADNVQEAFARQAHVDRLESPVWYRCVEAAGHRGGLWVEAVVRVLEELRPTGLACEFSRTPLGIVAGLRHNQPGVGLHDLDDDLRQLRRVKEPDELELIRRSLRVAEAGLAAVRQQLRPGHTELDLYRLVVKTASEAAGEPVTVYGDFVSGPRCEEIGGPATDRRIHAGELVLLDYSVVLRGYRGDFCTTFVCAGEPTARQRDMQAACLAALEAGREALRPGVTGGEVFQACRSVLATRGWADHFPHHAGHGIGLGHPEAPFLVPESSEILQAGDVVTLEPGLYLAGVGGMRYEHNFVLTPTGCEQLTHHSLDLRQSPVDPAAAVVGA